ncbi:Hsp70 family protein [Actinophytocola oryzae]|uniref:Molecular chaperone DnaK n=1 Tax=Actinophytocola oryzae TaxID=502181 RepID=A0A4V3FQ47_9PSEU|nr:Hsp70 family protein [Actinophytocola oryzae]TDV35435.1 molecular chaperone DnaK [Actinophytocola oryzae]
MRDTIDFGIDLGTTNSAIAVVEDGAVTVIKNEDGADITPSAVWIPKPNEIQIGRWARNGFEIDPENYASEFKLEMGLADAGRSFHSGQVTMTPQQLSAEILKALRADAASHCGAAPDIAVITVPAAFALNQNKATSDAATLAGLGTMCPLVQEPTAAAFAYGFQESDERAYWMVFDFGGGTFDAAVVSKRDGDLRVLNHAGDPYLGGKLIDWAVVERILAPAVSRDLDLRDFRRDNPAWRENFAKLKSAAETAKIQLSRRDQVNLRAELATVEGRSQTFEYALRRDEVDAIAEPFYARAVNLCRRALAEASLTSDDIDRLLLVGGVTLSPGLRERLSDPREGLGIEFALNLDPTTVVARGAAIFASTVRRPRSRQAPPAPGEYAVELDYEPSVTTTRPTIAGRLSGSASIDWTTYSVTVSNPDGRPPFRSGRIALNADGVFVTEVEIDEHQTSRFTVELTDETGTRRKLSPNSLSITHRDVEFGGVRLARSLGIQLVDRTFAPLLSKGTTLPTDVRKVFRTSDAFHRSDSDAVVRIPVIQGERDRADRNQQVGVLEIRPTDVRIDLPSGTEVEVTFEVDTSSLVTVIADVPLVKAQFEAEINLTDTRTPTTEALREMLDDAESRLDTLRRTAATGTSSDARQRLRRLEEEGTVATAREQVRAAPVEIGAAASAEERIRDLQAELDDVEDAVRLPQLRQELDELLLHAEDPVGQFGDASDRQELAELRRRAQEAAEAGNPTAVRELIERANVFLVELERRSPDWPVKLYFGLVAALSGAGVRGADQLVREGKQAIAARDEARLHAVNQRLLRLLPAEEKNKIIGLVES